MPRYRTNEIPYLDYARADAELGDKSFVTLAHHTYLERRWVSVARGEPLVEVLDVRFHSTVILSFRPDGSVVVNTGGWQTVTTKARLNALLPCRFFAKAYQWYVQPGGRIIYGYRDAEIVTVDWEEEPLEYFDGMVLDARHLAQLPEGAYVGASVRGKC
jgi:hypothetical protein